MFRVARFILMLVILSLPAFGAASAFDPGTDAFWRVWARTDKPVEDGTVVRSWMWGTEAFTPVRDEPYAESPDGFRQVQYFDKSRMEITHPGADPFSDWYVTNGLLVFEMITGKLQVGQTAFEPMPVAEINVAGDLDDPTGPTYRTFSAHLDDPSLPTGAAIIQTIDRDGTVADDTANLGYGVEAGELDAISNHATASVFHAFIAAQGPVYVNDALTTGIVSGIYATGRPITEAYWTTVRVAGTERDVLVQCFERRCLTYTPANPPAWQVEMGNVGQHYYEWRYGQLPTSEIFVMNADGSQQHLLPYRSAHDSQPVWSPDGNRIAFSRWHNGEGGLFIMDVDGTDVCQITDFISYGFRWSPDSEAIAVTGSILASGNQMQHAQIFIVAADGSGHQQLTSAEAMPAPALSAGNGWPDWSPDGQQLTFIGDQVNSLSQVYVIDRDGTNVRQLTDSPVHKVNPTWSVDGTWIAFSTDAADADIWLVRLDGSELQNLTASPSIEVGQVWSPVDQQIAFVRQDDAGIQIVARHADGSSERVLYDSPDHVLSLSWSPTGDRILFARGNLGSTSDLYIITVADGMIQQLTDTPTSELDPAWSPDGTRIVYTSDYGETYK